MIWFAFGATQYVNKPITRTSGLYYEQVKFVKIQENDWNLVTYIDLKLFDNKLKLIEKTYDESKLLCSTTNDFTHLTSCKTFLAILEKIKPNLFQTEKTLKTITAKPRAKRAWFNLLGSALKTVFGTLDQNDALFYNNAINNIDQNEKHYLNLLEQQVQVIKSTITNFNQTISGMDKNKELLNSNFKKIANITSDLNKKYFNLELKQSLEEHFNLLILLSTEL